MHASFRPTGIVLALAAVTLMTSGCGMFRKKNELYTESTESRPLEVPPDLDRPSAENAMLLPDAGTGSVSASGSASTLSPLGFVVAGDRDAVYARVGDALAATAGVTIASRAEILGTYDITYQGANFLVRVTRAGSNAYVSAVDPRGLPPTGDAPLRLISALKATLAP